MGNQKKELTEKILTSLEKNIETLHFREYWNDNSTWKIHTLCKGMKISLYNKIIRDDFSSDWEEYYMLELTKTNPTGNETINLLEIFNPECLENAPHEDHVQIERLNILINKIRSLLLKEENRKEQKLISECLEIFK